MPSDPRPTTDTGSGTSEYIPVTEESAADSGNSQICPLCVTLNTDAYTHDRFRLYRVCCNCSLVYVPPRFHVSVHEEKKRYDLHRNNPDDPGYRIFLSRLFDPIRHYIADGAHGLDFGSGPGPALPAMFRECGYRIDVYDKCYAADPAVFQKKYDFITATEVLEHLQYPAQEIDRLFTMLKPGGVLGIMTKLVIDRQAFDTWHYKNDKTHICFFSIETFRWLSDRLQTRVEFIGKDVILMHKF